MEVLALWYSLEAVQNEVLNGNLMYWLQRQFKEVEVKFLVVEGKKVNSDTKQALLQLQVETSIQVFLVQSQEVAIELIMDITKVKLSK